MNNKLNLINILTESALPQWKSFRTKLNVKLASGSYQFEEAFVRDLERMAAEGKIKYDKYTRKITELVANDKGSYILTDDDFKILMRSYNFRQAVIKNFDELKIDAAKRQDLLLTTGNYARIWTLFSEVPENRVIRGGSPSVIVPTTPARIQKDLSDFARKYFSGFQKLIKIYDASMQEFLVLEKQLDDVGQRALGKLTSSGGIGPEIREMNALILRMREFNRKHPKIFWSNAKDELLRVANGNPLYPKGKELVDAVENSRYFTIFKERFENLSVESTRVPNNTITRWQGFTRGLSNTTTSLEGKWYQNISNYFRNISWNPKDSRVISIITLLDTRTIRELQFNAKIRGNTVAAQSYILYKLTFIFVLLPILESFLSALADGLLLNVKYTEEELDLLFKEGEDRESRGFVIQTMFVHHLSQKYKTDPEKLLYAWSPLLNYLFSTMNTKTGRDSATDEVNELIRREREEFSGWLGGMRRNYESFGRWWDSRSGDDIINSNESPQPTPEPTPTATDVPTSETSEDISESEIDSWVDVNLADIKSEIKKPYTFNSDKSVSIFLMTQSDPLVTLIKNNGSIKSK